MRTLGHIVIGMIFAAIIAVYVADKKIASVQGELNQCREWKGFKATFSVPYGKIGDACTAVSPETTGFGFEGKKGVMIYICGLPANKIYEFEMPMLRERERL